MKVKLPVRSAVKPARFTATVVEAVTVTTGVVGRVSTLKLALADVTVTPVRPVRPRLATETEATRPLL